MKAETLVVDTNVLISARLLAGSKPDQVLDHVIRHRLTLLFSEDTFAELNRRLRKAKFSRYVTPEEIDEFLVGLIDLAEFHQPVSGPPVCRDRDDDKFLDLAVAGNADCIITGDKDLLVLHPFQGIPILSPADFLGLTTQPAKP